MESNCQLDRQQRRDTVTVTEEAAISMNNDCSESMGQMAPCAVTLYALGAAGVNELIAGEVVIEGIAASTGLQGPVVLAALTSLRQEFGKWTQSNIEKALCVAAGRC